MLQCQPSQIQSSLLMEEMKDLLGEEGQKSVGIGNQDLRQTIIAIGRYVQRTKVNH